MCIKHHGVIVLISIFLNIFFNPSADARILQVPGEYASIQAAVDASEESDTILVADGVYLEHVVIETRSLTLGSQYLLDGNREHADRTIMRSPPEGEFTSSPLRIYNEAGNSMVIKGISFTGARLNIDIMDDSTQTGGGIFAYGGSIDIEECRFYDNRAATGGGLYLKDCQVTFINNDLYHNTFSVSGGGLYLKDRNWTPNFQRIEGNHFWENGPPDSTYEFSGGAGFVINVNLSPGIFSNNLVENNWAVMTNGGGLISASAPDAGTRWEISYNSFLNNMALFDSGGLRVWGHYEADIHNNTFEGNVNYDGMGSGLNVYHVEPTLLIHENRFIHNQARFAGAVFTESEGRIYDNIFISNSAQFVSAILPWLGTEISIEVDHNIFVDERPLDEELGRFVAAVGTTRRGSEINLHENDFLHNWRYAAGVQPNDNIPQGVVHATNNYWGDPTGPYHEIENPGGLGDTVRSNVSILPFSSTPFTMPDSFNLIFPDEETVIDSLPVYFLWHSAPDRTTLEPVTYTLELSTEPDFAEFDPIPVETDTAYALTEADYQGQALWRVRATDSFGLSRLSAVRSLFFTGVPENAENGLPKSFQILATYPNPFNAETKVVIGVPQTAQVTVTVIDLLGREVARLGKGELSPGVHAFTWQPQGLASGIYLIRLSTAKATVQTRKLLLLR